MLTVLEHQRTLIFVNHVDRNKTLTFQCIADWTEPLKAALKWLYSQSVKHPSRQEKEKQINKSLNIQEPVYSICIILDYQFQQHNVFFLSFSQLLSLRGFVPSPLHSILLLCLQCGSIYVRVHIGPLLTNNNKKSIY